MISNTFRQIAASTVTLASILSASTAFAQRDWNQTPPSTTSGPVASASRDTGSVSQAPVSAAPSGMRSDRDQTGRTSITSLSSTSSSNPYATFANPYERNPTTDGSGH